MVLSCPRSNVSQLIKFDIENATLLVGAWLASDGVRMSTARLEYLFAGNPGSYRTVFALTDWYLLITGSLPKMSSDLSRQGIREDYSLSLD